MPTDQDRLMTTMAKHLCERLRSLSLGSIPPWLLLTLLASSCSREPLLPPDLGLACTMTGPSACKPDASVSVADGMSMSDAMPIPDAMSGPRPCASDSDCVMSCVMGALGCIIGACVIVSGGQHVAYVSLVELESGNIVWFNLLRGSKGDVREADGAGTMIDAIMAGMPSRPGEMAAPTTDIAAK